MAPTVAGVIAIRRVHALAQHDGAGFVERGNFDLGAAQIDADPHLRRPPRSARG